MKRVLLLAIVVGMAVLASGCTFLDKIGAGATAEAFYLRWLASDETGMADKMLASVTYNGVSSTNLVVAADLADTDWWTNYNIVRDPSPELVLDGGKANYTKIFSIAEKNVPEHEHEITFALELVKDGWSWNVRSVSISDDWRLH